MEKLYIHILEESLEKKIRILDGIISVNQEQREGLEDPNLDPDDFDKTVEKKAEYIDQLDQLDKGFEELFARVREELNTNREKYKAEIQTMQGQIRKITDKSLIIERQETQNKELMEKKFTAVRSQAREVRKSQKIVNQYYKSMMKISMLDPQFMDNKK